LTGRASDEELEKLDKEGKIVEDWWADLPDIGKKHSEDVHYTTQKVEDLLTRIIEVTSKNGMIIADFFVGSGTTTKVANDLNRKFIVCDIGINALQITRDHLIKAGVSFDIIKVQDGLRLFRNCRFR